MPAALADQPTCGTVENSYPEGTPFAEESERALACSQWAPATGRATDVGPVRRPTDGEVLTTYLAVAGVDRLDMYVPGDDGPDHCRSLAVDVERGQVIPRPPGVMPASTPGPHLDCR